MDYHLRAAGPHLRGHRRAATRYDAVHHRPRSLETRLAIDGTCAGRVRCAPSGRTVTRVVSHSRKFQIPNSKEAPKSKLESLTTDRPNRPGVSDFRAPNCASYAPRKRPPACNAFWTSCRTT